MVAYPPSVRLRRRSARRLLALLLVLPLVGLVPLTMPGPGAMAAEDPSPTLEPASPLRIGGVLRWGQTMTVAVGSTTPAATTTGIQWVRDGKPIPGANASTYRLRVGDYGTSIGAVVAARRPGHRTLVRRITAPGTVDHRVPVRRTVTYRIAFRGTITADTSTFGVLTAQSFADPRGWRAAGVAFRRVRTGGDFTLWLSSADAVPSFGPPCDSTWSCRTGRNVIINQTRWLHASPAWNRQGLALRDYRHMVLNHETGHWLGHRHRSCPAPGAPAPVMMQQSKGLQGCRFNPFPRADEWWFRR